MRPTTDPLYSAPPLALDFDEQERPIAYYFDAAVEALGRTQTDDPERPTNNLP